MHTRTIVDRIEIEPQTGNVGVRLCKQVLSDNGAIISNDYHRTMIDPGTTPAAQITTVNAHLAQMGFPAVNAADVAILDAAIAPLTSFRATKAQEARARER